MTNIIPYLTLATIGTIFLGSIIWDVHLGSSIFSDLPSLYSGRPLDPCDNINRLFYEFNVFRELLDKETHINMPTNSWKESFYYWLNGNSTQNNWFDKTCHTGWDYVKGTCTVNPTHNSKEFVDYWLCGNSTKANWFDEACSISWDFIKCTCTINPTHNSKEFVDYWLCGNSTQNNWFDEACSISWDFIKNTGIFTPVDSNLIETLVTCEASSYKSSYFLLGLGCLVAAWIFNGIYYNFDTLKAIDEYLYNILCMFDFPGFMVNSRSAMPLGPNFELAVTNSWNVLRDPGDGVTRLLHMVRYNLVHEHFWFEFIAYSPSWSRTNFLELMIGPGLDWPFNYDNFHYITLFDFAWIN